MKPKEAKMNLQKGFTLIEVLLVLVIMLILSAIIMFNFPKYIKMSYKSTAISNARNCLSIINSQLIEGENVNPPQNCNISSNYDFCSCTVSGFAGSVTCKIVEGGSVECKED